MIEYESNALMTAHEPVKFIKERVPSPLGSILLYLDDRSVLRALNFEDREDHLNRILRRRYGPISLSSGSGRSFAAEALQAYFDGDLAQLSTIPIEARGTLFQMTTWARLREVKPGTTVSYGALAARIGRPEASRAVGTANSANPIALVIPCHRVVGSNLHLTGYGPGLSRKRWLLDHEGCPAEDRPVFQPADYNAKE
jgi:methylated-DNA-[protein]-cysteine S-methyltransferase